MAFLFGSEIKSFLDYPGFEKKINRDALKMYLEFQYSPLPETIFSGVYRLMPGTMFFYDGENGLVTEKYFEPEYSPEKRSLKMRSALLTGRSSPRLRITRSRMLRSGRFFPAALIQAMLHLSSSR